MGYGRPMARGQRAMVLALIAVLGACSGDDSPDDAESPGSTGAAPQALSTVETVPFTPENTLVSPAGLEQLSAGLLGASELGVPESWAILDIDPLVPDEVRLADDADPFLGLLECADGVTREGTDRAWIARRFTAPESPLDNGLLSVELTIEIESTEEFAADRAALAACVVGEQATVAFTDEDLPLALVPAVNAPATAVLLSSEPTESVPYPSVLSAVFANHSGFTATVVFAGLDQGTDWQIDARDLAARLLVELQP